MESTTQVVLIPFSGWFTVAAIIECSICLLGIFIELIFAYGVFSLFRSSRSFAFLYLFCIALCGIQVHLLFIISSVLTICSVKIPLSMLKAKKANTYKAPDQYKTQVSVAQPKNKNQGSATTVQDRKDDTYIEDTNKIIENLLQNEKQMETFTIIPGRWQTYKRCRKEQPYEKSYQEYCEIVKKIGHKMWMAWPKTTALDGTVSEDFPEDIATWPDLKDLKPPYCKEDDINLEYQWQ